MIYFYSEQSLLEVLESPVEIDNSVDQLNEIIKFRSLLQRN